MALNFKTLTTDNWLKPDPASTIFAKLSHSDGSITRMSGEDWVLQFLNPALDNTVPENVRELFEVARGSLAYGYFFYPLYALAGEQLFRVAESAVSEKCQSLNAPKTVRNFADKIRFLLDNNIISGQGFSEWEGVRKFRNLTSHPDQQNILPPGTTAAILENMAIKINGLFK